MAFIARRLVSTNKKRYHHNGYDLDLSYITDNVIAMGFPSEGVSGLYRNPMGQVVRLLEARHAGHYKVYNLCIERGYDDACFGGRVMRLPMCDGQAPPLALLLALVRDAAAWLAADPANVVAVHCKAGKGRTGAAVCALLLALEPRVSPGSLPEVLAHWARQRTKDGKGLTIASQRRYVEYFHTLLLSGARDCTGAHITLQPAVVTAHKHDSPFGGHSPVAHGAGARDTSAAVAGACRPRLECVTVPERGIRLLRLRFRGLPPGLLRDCTVGVWSRPPGHYRAHAVCRLHTRPGSGPGCLYGSTADATASETGSRGATFAVRTYQGSAGLEEGELVIDLTRLLIPSPTPPPLPLPYFTPAPPASQDPKTTASTGAVSANACDQPMNPEISKPVGQPECDHPGFATATTAGASVSGSNACPAASSRGLLLYGDIKIQLFRGCVPEPDPDVFKGGVSQFAAWFNTSFLDPRVAEVALGRRELDKLSKPLRRWGGGVGLTVEYEAVGSQQQLQ